MRQILFCTEWLVATAIKRALAGAVVILLLQCVVAKAQSKDPALPSFIAPGSTELKPKTKFLLADGAAPEEVQLGDLETGVSYFARVPFINMLANPIRIVGIRSSCGCLAAASSDESVPSKGESFFVIHIQPQPTAAKYAKTVTLLSLT